MTAADFLTLWAAWDLTILAAAVACLVRRDDPDLHRFHLEDQ